MRDPTLTQNVECTFSASAAAGSKPPSIGTNANSNTNNNLIGPCGEGPLRCEFTFFVPNGTAIENFAQTPYGRQVMNEPQRWRWIMRRLMTSREKIYIDQLAVGAPRSFYADNGEELIVQVDAGSSGRQTAYIMFEGIRAQVVHSDIGATNGVIHIISSLLFVPEDLARDVSGPSTIEVSQTTKASCLH
uniref:FAS1 domain-containing protein n=1 Tax=Biomphalaria glabrata TaxID=6526 RepID=A0A2C9LQL9_BIOGL